MKYKDHIFEVATTLKVSIRVRFGEGRANNRRANASTANLFHSGAQKEEDRLR